MVVGKGFAIQMESHHRRPQHKLDRTVPCTVSVGGLHEVCWSAVFDEKEGA
jgi:hypothetical protein